MFNKYQMQRISDDIIVQLAVEIVRDGKQEFYPKLISVAEYLIKRYNLG